MARSRPPAARRFLLLALTLAAVAAASVVVVAADQGNPVAAAASSPASTPSASTPTASTAGPTGSTAGATSDPAASPAAAASSSAAAAASAAASSALAAVQSAADGAGGSIAVVVLGPDGSTLLAGSGADTPTYTASLVKLLVVQQLLRQSEAGQLTLDAADLALMERAVEASDDDAMDTLWVRFDGSALVTDAATEFGLTGTATTAVTGQWGQATTTARDYARFLAALPGSLTAADRATLAGWMQSTTDAAADGFDQDYGVRTAGVLATGSVQAKQGWMCCVDSRRQVHSAGVLSDGRVVVLLGDFPAGTTWAAGQSALDAAAQAVVAGT